MGCSARCSLDEITDGHYYRKQLGCKSRFIAWSHRSRFELALRLLGPSTKKLLDYGCGDGTFLSMAADRVQAGCGADITPDQIQDCQTRLAKFGNLRFLTTPELAGAEHEHAYDVVTCMETLEHCSAPIVELVLSDLARLVADQGRVIISVPIEIGPTFVLKGVVRKLAAWRGLSDYKYYESYSMRNALRMIFASRKTTFDRPLYGEPNAQSHSHYGFNWRAMRQRVQEYFHIERTRFSPLGFLGGWVSSQAWFLCRPRSR